MKLAFISPIKHLEDFSSLGDIQFALAHVKSRVYRRYYKDAAAEGWYTILDNGSHELGASVDANTLWKAAKYIKPNEIVVPDVQWNAEETLRISKQFMNYVTANGLRHKYKYMSVVWAPDVESFPFWYQKHLELNCDVVGIGKWLSTKYNRRVEVVKGLISAGIYDDSKEHHLLGMGYPGEVFELGDVVRSMDTGAPVVFGSQHRLFHKGLDERGLASEGLGRVLDMKMKLKGDQFTYAGYNCRVLLDYAHNSKYWRIINSKQKIGLKYAEIRLDLH